MDRGTGLRWAAVATALVLAAGAGGAVAGDLITGKDIKDGSVSGKDVKDHSLTGKDISASTLGDLQGPPGQPGAPGADAAGATAIDFATTVDTTGTVLATVGPFTYSMFCDAGDIITNMAIMVTSAATYDVDGVVVLHPQLGSMQTSFLGLGDVTGEQILVSRIANSGDGSPAVTDNLYAGPVIVSWSGGSQQLALAVRATASAPGETPAAGCRVVGQVTQGD